MTLLDRRGFIGALGAGVALLGGNSTGLFASGARKASTDLSALVHGHLDLAIAAGIPGACFAALRGEEVYVAGAGNIAGPGSAIPDGNTIFQLGSITKTLTGLGLAIADQRGRLRIDDPLAAHVPWEVPVFDNRPITLVDLATQSSGLPRLPPNFGTVPGYDPTNPYASYDSADMAKGLPATKLLSEPGTEYAYSNLGFGLLGQALNANYEAVLRPMARALGMADTTTELNPLQRNRKATGHGVDGSPVQDWTGPLFAGGGDSNFSTTNDLVRYLRAQLRPETTVFAEELRRVQQPHFRIDPNTQIGFGWQLVPLPSKRTVILHDGATGGFSTFAAFCPESRTAVALMTNLTLIEDVKRNSVETLGPNMIKLLDADFG